jgi:uncharacterized OB-fold protein
MVQSCSQCGYRQLYPRPFCLECYSDNVVWADASGKGIVYSKTIVHIAVVPDLAPPYVVAIVELDEGPRLVTNLADLDIKIGDRVRLAWRDRTGAPPFPIFVRDD